MIYVGVLLILGTIYSVIVFFCGSPIKKMEVSRNAEQYLKEKYGKEFVTSDAGYYFDHGDDADGYYAHVYELDSDGTKNDIFIVNLEKIKDLETYRDLYKNVKWRKEFGEVLEPSITNILKKSYSFYGLYNYDKEFERGKDLPHISEVKDIVRIGVGMIINEPYSNVDEGLVELYDLMYEINKSGYKIVSFKFVFHTDSLEGKVRNELFITTDQLMMTSSYEQLKTYLESRN